MEKTSKKIGGFQVWKYDEIIDKVTENKFGYLVETKQKGGFIICYKYAKVAPKAGDKITFYTILVTQVVGIDLNGVPLYFLEENQL